ARVAADGQEESKPLRPLCLGGNIEHPVDILVLSRFEAGTGIEDRRRDELAREQDQGDEYASDAAVAVGEGMDGLELVVDQSCFQEWGNTFAPGTVDKRFQRVHRRRALCWRRG